MGAGAHTNGGGGNADSASPSSRETTVDPSFRPSLRSAEGGTEGAGNQHRAGVAVGGQARCAEHEEGTAGEDDPLHLLSHPSRRG